MKSESYVKCFDGYTHLIVMLFGALKHFDSLRELEIDTKGEIIIGELIMKPNAVQHTVAEVNSPDYKSSFLKFIHTC